MRFTRIHLFLLIIGITGIGSGIFSWMLHHQETTLLVEQIGPNTEYISGNYTYTPIEKNERVQDLEYGETSLFSSTGHIKVNLNSSSIEELCRLPGIGKSTAIRMLEYRLAKGPFLRVEELDNVKGVGKKTIEKIADQAFVGEPEILDHSMIEKLTSEQKNGKKDQKTSKIEASPCGPGRININTATAEELISLPKIGAKTADRIIADRQANGPFKDVNDLVRVKGIGAKTLEKMKDRICAE